MSGLTQMMRWSFAAGLPGDIIATTTNGTRVAPMHDHPTMRALVKTSVPPILPDRW
jgi:hypothetical protein